MTNRAVFRITRFISRPNSWHLIYCDLHISMIWTSACYSLLPTTCVMSDLLRETMQMAVCCQNLPLGALSSRSALPVPVGALFKKFGLYLNTPCKRDLGSCGMLSSVEPLTLPAGITFSANQSLLAPFTI